MHQSSNGNEVTTDVLSQNHNMTSSNINAYTGFTNNESHVQNVSTPTSASLDFHHQQILNTGNSTRVKDHGGMTTTHRSTHQTSAAAMAAAMMLDPRYFYFIFIFFSIFN